MLCLSINACSQYATHTHTHTHTNFNKNQSTTPARTHGSRPDQSIGSTSPISIISSEPPLALAAADIWSRMFRRLFHPMTDAATATEISRAVSSPIRIARLNVKHFPSKHKRKIGKKIQSSLSFFLSSIYLRFADEPFI